MIEIINKITGKSIIGTVKANKRYIKLLLLLAGFEPEKKEKIINIPSTLK